MERPEIYTDNYNSLEEWIELRKRNEEFVYPQFFVPFREWMKDIEQKSDMEIKELLRILLQPYTLGQIQLTHMNSTKNMYRTK